MDISMNPVYEKLMRCYESVKQKIEFKPEIALILGSGLGDYAEPVSYTHLDVYKRQD